MLQDMMFFLAKRSSSSSLVQSCSLVVVLFPGLDLVHSLGLILYNVHCLLHCTRSPAISIQQCIPSQFCNCRYFATSATSIVCSWRCAIAVDDHGPWSVSEDVVGSSNAPELNNEFFAFSHAILHPDSRRPCTY